LVAAEGRDVVSWRAGIVFKGALAMEIATRTCTKCRKQKDVGQFGKNKRLKGGMSYWCLDCWREYHAEYRIENRYKIRARNREYSAKYYRAHKDKVKAARAET
jgi:DNA-directed RNA polymerase subunit RPC12/RpoP